MAKMYPPEISKDTESKAEERLFYRFKEDLPDDFIVMHGVRWLVRNAKKRDRHGEIDFLIIHPKRGLLVLEVKGGKEVGIDGETGRWYSIDRADQRHDIKDPFAQAENNLFELLRKIEDAPATRLYLDDYRGRIRHGIAFPSIIVGREGFGTDAPRDIIIDSTDVHSLELAVRRIMGSPGNNGPLSDDAIRALRDLLKPTRKIDRVGLGYQVLSTSDEIIELTEQQYNVLDTLQLQRRALIHGCAGSGKTMLAMEKARRLAAEGFRVLFTCYNENLGGWVREQFRHDPNPLIRKIDVAHYNKLAHDFCSQAGVLTPPESSEDLDHYFSEVMPERLFDALTIIPDRFDAIVADEGQDISEKWWEVLPYLLKDPDHGIFYIFYDDNQRIYQRENNFPFKDPEYPLTINCRNTDRIHRRVVRYHKGTPKPRSSGLEGPEPEIVPVENGNRVEALRKVFTRLFTEEHIPADQVVILTPRSGTSDFKRITKIGTKTLTWNKRPGTDEVRICSIHSFKGLESPVVILAELDRIHPDSPRDELLYVATSRAQSHLIVLGELPDPVTQPPPGPTESDLDSAGFGEDIEVELNIAAEPATESEVAVVVAPAIGSDMTVDPIGSTEADVDISVVTATTASAPEAVSGSTEPRPTLVSARTGRAPIRRRRLTSRSESRPSLPSPRIGRGDGGEGHIPEPLALSPPTKWSNEPSIPPPLPPRAAPGPRQLGPEDRSTSPDRPPTDPPGNGWAVAGLLCGILALFIHILAIAAIIAAAIGLSKTREHGGRGKAAGWIGLALGVIVVLQMLQ